MKNFLSKVIMFFGIIFIPAILFGTDIFDAAKKGDLEAIKDYIKNDGDINFKNIDGCSALYFAAGEGKTDCVKLLIDAKANVNAKDDGGGTSLMLATGDFTRAEGGGIIPYLTVAEENAVKNAHADCVKLLIDASQY
jgi:hypothetical protein